MTVVFVEEVRDMGGAPRPGVPGMLPSFLGMGESFLVDSDDCIRPIYVSL